MRPESVWEAFRAEGANDEERARAGVDTGGRRWRHRRSRGVHGVLGGATTGPSAGLMAVCSLLVVCQCCDLRGEATQDVPTRRRQESGSRMGRGLTPSRGLKASRCPRPSQQGMWVRMAVRGETGTRQPAATRASHRRRLSRAEAPVGARVQDLSSVQFGSSAPVVASRQSCTR